LRLHDFLPKISGHSLQHCAADRPDYAAYESIADWLKVCDGCYPKRSSWLFWKLLCTLTWFHLAALGDSEGTDEQTTRRNQPELAALKWPVATWCCCVIKIDLLLVVWSLGAMEGANQISAGRLHHLRYRTKQDRGPARRNRHFRILRYPGVSSVDCGRARWQADFRKARGETNWLHEGVRVTHMPNPLSQSMSSLVPCHLLTVGRPRHVCCQIPLILS
jgi:hypothetical protein